MSGELRQPRRRRGPRRPAAALAVVLVASLLGCGRGGDDATGEGPFAGAPVVIISIDTLRSDHLPAYGYRGVATPAIDELRGDGLLFAHAYSQIPLTLPSHVSMFTGELPAVHGVRDNVGYRYDAKRFPGLGADFSQAGYATGGFVSAFVLRQETGIAAGFDTWDDDVKRRYREPLGNSQRRGTDTVEAALRWLPTVADRPFLLFIHLYDPHSPYEPPEPYASRARLPYDGEIAAADAAVGMLLDDLKRRGLYERSIVMLLADHGEGLGDHGEAEHGLLLYREALQVPLLLKLPGGRRAGERVEVPVGLVDVYPTLRALAGLEGGDRKALAGRPLLLPSDGPREIVAETYYPRLHYGWSELVSVIRDRYHYIHGPSPELFDVVADPAERRDLLRDQRRVYAELRQVAVANKRELAGPEDADEETRKRLAALGYASSTVRVAAGEELPNPRERIGSLARLQEAANLVTQRDYAKAVPLLRQLTAENPHMVDAWALLGSALHGAGRLEESLAAYQRALRESPGATQHAAGAGKVLLALGRRQEAKEHAELALAVAPASGHELLAQIAVAAGDLATAEREAKAALTSSGDRVGALLTLAEVQTKKGELEAALSSVDSAQQEVQAQGGDQRIPGLQQVRGDVLARLGQADEAETAFRAEIESFPTALRAYAGLALLYAAQGRAADAVAVLRGMVESNGGSAAAYAEAVRSLRALGDPQDAAALLRHALALHPKSAELRSLVG
jgi:arylsulfatase A-like enzyme/Tfp pilus assembly protein PilF